MKKDLKKYIFHAQGMHCKSCAVLIEGILSEVSYIDSVKVNANSHSVLVSTEREMFPEDLATELNSYIEKDGYILSVEKQKYKIKWKDFVYALPIASLLIFGFVTLQKAGLINFINAEEVSYPVALGIGMIASISSCLAVVGGLLLSVSANYAKSGSKIKPQIFFHSGRLISFFIFGGIIGVIGSAFTLSVNSTFVLSVLVGLVMLVLGINLLEVITWAKKLQIHMPKNMAKGVHSLKGIKSSTAPFLIGVATFFLPCGFTQSMQIYSLTTGSFIKGALTMTFFALGTLPVLALISFSSVKFGNGKFSSIFFKSAGILVIVFALITILNGLVAKGIIAPFINF